jgi:hypothetical protein
MITYPPNYDPNDESNKSSIALNLSPSSYSNNGLYHKYDHLINVYPEIINWDIEEQIKYSDAITRRYCLNKNFLLMQGNLLTMQLNHITKSNTTAIGNIACIAFYNKQNSDWNECYIKIINHLKQRV